MASSWIDLGNGIRESVVLRQSLDEPSIEHFDPMLCWHMVNSWFGHQQPFEYEYRFTEHEYQYEEIRSDAQPWIYTVQSDGEFG
ncbi:MAG: hypothetical protein ACK6AO_09195 [Planctomycetota bacterium]